MAQLQLNQVLALEKGVKARAFEALTKAHNTLAQGTRLVGISRTYQPREDGGEQLPPESTKVQFRVGDALEWIETYMGRLFDVELTKDAGNQTAMADIVVNGTVLAEAVPISFLLFLEKQLGELVTFVARIPVLDPSETWAFEPSVDAYRTESVQTVRTKKIPRNHVKAEATDRFPAQVEMYTEDVSVGYWTTTKFSGAMPQTDLNEIRGRLVQVQEAVKQAREKANSILVADRKIGSVLLGYIFE